MAGRQSGADAPSVGIGFGREAAWRKPKNVEVGWKYVHCAGFDVDAEGKEHYHHIENIPCDCPPGPQSLTLTATAQELGFFGGRGSMKTETAIAFACKGNADRIAGDDTDFTYLANPNYSALVLRKTQDDLDDFFHRLARFPLVKANLSAMAEKPFKMRFQSGARFDFGHMQDMRSLEDIQGKEYVRILIEELGQIGSEELYLMILGSCRTRHKGMVAQSFATANPGGPGNRWIKTRFMRDLTGAKVEPGTVQRDPEGRSRVYFHSTVFDNPYYLAGNRDYVRYLRSLRGTLREQWLHGSFDAVEGVFFEHFRAEKRAGEEENACHVLKCTKEQPEPVKLAHYWPRAIGVDWGYSHNSVALWGCWHPKGQLHVYRELSVSRKGTVALGAEIAIKSLPDLEAAETPHMNIYLSPDAFTRTDDTYTEAEQIAKGINSILGRDSAFVFAPTAEESRMDSAEAWESVRRRQNEFGRHAHLTIVPAKNARKPGWNLIREYLRWWPLVEGGIEFNEETAKKILLTQGTMAYHEYKKSIEKQTSEVLPKLQIWDCCQDVIKGLEEAQEKPTDREDVLKVDTVGDDAADSLRYLCMGFMFSEAVIPKQVYVAEKLKNLQASGVGADALIMAARVHEHNYDAKKKVGNGFSIPRLAGPTARHMSRRVN